MVRRRRFRLLGVVVILVMMIIVVGFLVLVFGRMDETIKAQGLVEPAAVVGVRPCVGGIVERVCVTEGGHVGAGDTLLVLKADEMRFQVERAKQALVQAEADLAQLREEYDNLIISESFETQSAFANLYQAKRRAEMAHEKYIRAEELFEKNLISSEERDDRKLDYELTQSYYASLRDRAELLQKRYMLRIEENEKEVSLARREYDLAVERLSESVILCPAGGCILTKNPGSLLGSMAVGGEAILEIGNLEDLVFMSEVGEADIPEIEIGQKVKIFINAFPHRRYKVFEGRITRISTAPKRTDRGIAFDVRIGMDDPWIEASTERTPLRPGLSGEAKIVTRENVRLIEMLFDLNK